MAAIQDAEHPEHEDLLEWVGGEFDIEIFCKDGWRLVAKFVSRLQMEIFTAVRNPMVHSSDFGLCFFLVLSILLFARRSALPQFQLLRGFGAAGTCASP